MTAAGLPVAAAVSLLTDPRAVVIVRNGCRGYWMVQQCGDEIAAAVLRESINAALGVTIPQREALAAGSLFGFDCPAADPATYDDAGNIRPTAHN